MEPIKISIETRHFKESTGYTGNSCYLHTALKERFPNSVIDVGGMHAIIDDKRYGIPAVNAAVIFTSDEGINYGLFANTLLGEIEKRAKSGEEVNPINLTLTPM